MAITDKKGNKYDLFLCQKIETLVDETKKYKEKRAFYADRIESLPATVEGLTKEEILAEIKKNPSNPYFNFVLISASPVIDAKFSINNKNYTFSFSQTFKSFIDIVRSHPDGQNYTFSLDQTIKSIIETTKTPQNRVLFADRIDALPAQVGALTNQDITFRFGEIGLYGSYTYLIIIEVV